MQIEIVTDMSDDRIATVRIPVKGGFIVVMAEVELANNGDTLLLSGLNIHGEGVGPRDLKTGALIRVAQDVMEELDVSKIHIAGAVRVTGANPGRKPRPFWITRRDRNKGG